MKGGIRRWVVVLDDLVCWIDQDSSCVGKIP